MNKIISVALGTAMTLAVAGVSSFGDHPLPAYLIPAAPYTFEFTITPIWVN